MTKNFLRLLMISFALLLCGSLQAQQPNVSVNMKSAQRVGNEVWIDFMVTNNGSQNETWGTITRNTYAYDREGEALKFGMLFGKQWHSRDGYGWCEFPSGIPAKLTMIVIDVPTDMKSLAKVSVSILKGSAERTFSFTNVMIKEPAPNSDNGKTTLNYPWMKISTKKCMRDGENALLEFSLTASTQKEEFRFPPATAYDEEGNSYRCAIGNAQGQEVYNVSIDKGEKKNFVVKIRNISKDLKLLTAVKLPIELGRFKYEAKFSDVRIIDPIVSADDRISFDLKGKVRQCKVTMNGATQTYVFNENGQWTEWNGMDMKMTYPGGIIRDEQGRLSEGKRDEYGEYFHRFTYDEKGRIRTHYICEDMEGGYIETYRYSSQDEIIRIDRRGGFDPDGKPTVILCSILMRDQKGNWTKRKRGNVIETRTISYYE